MGWYEKDKSNIGLFFVNELRTKEEIDTLAKAVEVIINEQRFI